MSQVLPDPRRSVDGYLSLYAAIVAALIALAVLGVLILSGPRQMDRFAQGSYYCQPFVGKMPYC